MNITIFYRTNQYNQQYNTIQMYSNVFKRVSSEVGNPQERQEGGEGDIQAKEMEGDRREGDRREGDRRETGGRETGGRQEGDRREGGRHTQLDSVVINEQIYDN